MHRRQFLAATAGAILFPTGFARASQSEPAEATPQSMPQHHGRPRPIVLGDGIELIDYRIYPSDDVPRIIGEISSTRDDMIDSPVVSITFPELAQAGFAYAPPVLPVMRPGEANMIFGVLPKEIDSDEKLQTAEFGLCAPVGLDWSDRLCGTDFVATVEGMIREEHSFNVWGELTNRGEKRVEFTALQALLRDADNRYVGTSSRGHTAHFDAGQSKEFFLWASTSTPALADPYRLLNGSSQYSLELSITLVDFFVSPGCGLLLP